MGVTVFQDLGLVEVVVDGVVEQHACQILSEWIESPGVDFPPPPRPKKPRPQPAPAPSVQRIYERFVGYGR